MSRHSNLLDSGCITGKPVRPARRSGSHGHVFEIVVRIREDFPNDMNASIELMRGEL